MKIGDIYLYKDFTFKDGSKKNKFFVIIGLIKNNKYLACITTSQKKPPYRIKKAGCAVPKNDHYMIFKEKECFKKDTWILFDKIYSFSKKSPFSHVDSLTKQTTKSLLHCILKSEDVLEKNKKIIKKSLATVQSKSIKRI